MPKGIENTAELYGIYRRAASWTVRIVRGGKRHERGFSDAMYGGRESSLTWAQHWRNKILKRFPPPARAALASMPKSSNATGHAGVTYELDARGEIKLWRAKTYVSRTKVLQRTFSVSRWGASAESRAREERASQLQQLTGRRQVHAQERQLRRQPVGSAPPAPAARSIEVVRRSNTSGFDGVVRRRNPSGREHWTAQVTKDGRWTSRSYSIARLGEEVALILALMDRLDWMNEPPP
ncbi:MAG: hypothetical protein REJ50_26155 [Bordetella sp.]|nr:hypothetical protein [Bordetella sp.]